MPLSERRRPPPLHLVPRQTPTPTGGGAEEEEPEFPDVDSPDSVGTTPGPDSSDSEFESAEEEGDEAEEGAEEEEDQEEEETPEREGDPPAQPQISGIPMPNPSDRPKIQPTTTVTLPSAPSGSLNAVAGGGSVGQDPQKEIASKPPPSEGGGGMSKGAEAALVSLTVLGGIALIIGAILLIRRRKQAKRANTASPPKDTIEPDNEKLLRVPEPAYTGHATRTTTTNSLYAAAEYQRPETVSTERSKSRAQGLPTPNPFADPPLNKAYDVLRGRPRSTTLTDRGSWVKNPFKDPVSERFDPFGELQAKARLEREKYVEGLRLEQEYHEKERMGLGLPGRDVRKGSSVTVEGVGVLDRSAPGYLG